LDAKRQKPLIFQRLTYPLWMSLDYLESGNGRHDWIRTSDLFRVNHISDCNLLILGASAAPIGIQNHPKSTFSTIVSTIKTQKEKV